MYDPYQGYILETSSPIAEQYALARLLGNGAVLNPEQASMAVMGMTVTQLRLTPEYQDAVACFRAETGGAFYGE